MALTVAAGSLDVAAAERTLRGGGLAVLPTDTVYGVACAAYHRDAGERLLALKERPAGQATAIVVGTVDTLLDNVLPELLGRAGVIVRRALPGPLTLIVPNPGQRFAYACGADPRRIGIRVPALPPRVAELADRVGGLLMPSANPRGAPPPAALADVDPGLADACDLLVDGGRLPGTASSVVDITGPSPRVLRAGAGDAAVAGLLQALAG